MHIAATSLKPLSGVQLTEDESKILKWLRTTAWEAQKAEREPIPYKTKVPEFYAGVRLYRMTGGGGNALDLFIKKLQYQGVVAKQDLYPVAGHGAARTLALTKAELDNLGVGQEEED